MTTPYQPPSTITPDILNRVASISEAVGRLSLLADQDTSLRLRRINRVRTIRGSLAIEGNTLSEAQITAILDGKQVIAPPREVQEVKNALAAYDRFDSWRPESEKDLLGAHRMLMSGLIDEAGMYRRGGVGVMEGSRVIHMAPPAGRIPQLMGDLLSVLKSEMSREALQAALGLQDRKSFRERYLKSALANGLIEMTIPDRPRSRLQKYRLTDKGRHWLT
ncbi:Fic family protein [Desulfoplanes sp.]